MDKPATRAPVRIKFSRYEKVVIGILGFLQFTVILDFMIISPLAIGGSGRGVGEGMKRRENWMFMRRFPLLIKS
jgi:hypothetical protein